MRKIKFRLFNSKKGQYEKTFNIDKDGNVNSYTMFDNSESKEDCILEEFSGLKDKDGVEIYEGDIVQRDFNEKYYNEKYYTQLHERYVIEFGEQDLGHSSFQQTIGWNATPVLQYGKESLMDSGRLRNGVLNLYKCSVIGNIHQNTELLKWK